MTETDPWQSFEEPGHKTHTLPFDHTLCRGASMGDINMEALASLFQEERVQQQPWFHSDLTNEELLERLHLLQEGGKALTYGAVLCFGKKPFKWVAEAFTRCTSYKGDDRLAGWEEDLEFRGSLLQQYKLGIEFLQKNLRLNRAISSQGSVEQWEIPLVVLQEALANALMHRDYADQRDCVRVEIFDSRVEISSPGGLLGSLTIEQLGLVDQYPLRNPHITHVFYLCNYAENRGTGIARMQQEMKNARLLAPQFDTNGGRTFKIILRRPQHVEPHDDEETKTAIVLKDFLKRFEEANRSKTPLLPFDRTLCRDASLNDIDMDTVTNFSQKERVQKQPWFRKNMANRELLVRLGLLQETFLTYGAVLCFGKEPSKWVAGAFIRCTCWSGGDRLDGLEDDEFFHGSLLEQYESSILFLQRNLHLSRVIGSQGSVEQWEIPLVVLQEAVANALMHRDYADQTDQTDNVRIEVFDDRVEISSPGNLADGLTIAQLGKETRYASRNPQIAYIFYLCNYVGSFGTGIARMQRGMRNARLPQPQFDINNGRTFDVVLRRPRRVKRQKATNTSSFSARVKAVVSNRRNQWLALILAIILLVATFVVYPLSSLFLSASMGIGVINEPNNEQIGLSDGTYAFDASPDRADASLKIQAAAKFAKGDKVGAMSLWRQAVGKNGIDTSDAEALIYQEDQSVLASGSPYITLVVGTMLGGGASNISTGRDDLQGAYVAQKEYNDGHKLSDATLVRLLIANAGSNPDYVTEVAGQIVQAAKQDPTIVGVMGWAFSTYAQKAIPVLTQAHIPLVSSTASADSLRGVSRYFFRVVPSNNSQASAGAKYAEQQLLAHRVALFVDHNNPYSNSLAADFEQQFVADGNQIVDTENYTVGDKADLPAHLQSALQSNPDLIYFSGYADDLAVLLVNFPPSQPNLQVLGGDGLYDPNAYSSTAKLNFSRVHFTTFAYPDEWGVWVGLKDPPFFSEYSTDFNPKNADHSANPYGFTRADYEAILAYDATSALLQGVQHVIVLGEPLTAVNLRDGLAQITGVNAIQGVGGQISFDGHGDPMNKAILILYVDQDNHIHMLPPPDGVQGCFLVGQCDTNLP